MKIIKSTIMLFVFFLLVASVIAMPASFRKHGSAAPQRIDGEITSIGVLARAEPDYICISRRFENTGKECFQKVEELKIYTPAGLFSWSKTEGPVNFCPGQKDYHEMCFKLSEIDKRHSGEWTIKSTFFARHKSGIQMIQLDQKEETFNVDLTDNLGFDTKVGKVELR